MPRPISLVLWMALAIAAVTALAYWDEERESDAALSDFANEQATLAHAVSVRLAAELLHPADAAASLPAHVLSELHSLEAAHRLRVLLARPGRPCLARTDGSETCSATIERALLQHASTARLSRPEAAALGLPRRTAMAGLWSVNVGGAGPWVVVVVATARRERDRELRAERRLLLSVFMASSLVLIFGGLAVRKERRQIELAGKLAIAEVAQARDERLVRADKLATLGALATGIAHEVSTPLGVIVGRAEQILPRVADDERVRRGVETIIDQGRRIDQVIRGFLNLARGEQPTLEHVPAAEVAHAACELVEHRFEKASVRLQLRLGPDLPKIACEPRIFEQVLVNLLLNACDACQPRGHVTLQVRADAARVAFIVTDDGVGISPEAAARATEPFFTTKPAGVGTGLGLAITSEIVKHHHGTLTIAARANEAESSGAARAGTQACVELPAVQGET